MFPEGTLPEFGFCERQLPVTISCFGDGGGDTRNPRKAGESVSPTTNETKKGRVSWVSGPGRKRAHRGVE